MIRHAVMSLAVLGLALSIPQVGRADVACTISGVIEIEPMDTYYCDSDFLGCAGWKEVNLDTAVKPLAHMRLEFTRLSDGALLMTTATAANGSYVAVAIMPGTSCVGQGVRMRLRLERVDETNSSLDRFRVTAPYASNATWTTKRDFTLTSGSTVYNSLFTRGSGATTRAFNVYYSANSMISEIVSWTSDLSAEFSGPSGLDDKPLRIWYDIGYSVGTKFNPSIWSIDFDYADYPAGGTLRHEIGHAIHYALHDRNMYASCRSDNLNNNTPYGWDTCEWGELAMMEGIATFFAVASMVTPTTMNAFFCRSISTGSASRDNCSESFSTAVVEADRLIGIDSGTGTFLGVGDTYATHRTHCTRASPQSAGGCMNCSDADANNQCDLYTAYGHYTVSQIVRFFWDLIDTNQETNDDTSLAISGSFGLAQILDNMPCTGADYGVDGSCNEASRANAADCVPASTAGPVTLPHLGTRMSYNPRDIDDFIPLNLSGERTLNCLDQATD